MTKKDALLPLVMFVLMMFGTPAHAQTKVADIDRAIWGVYKEIKNMRNKNPELIENALLSNPRYCYVVHNRAQYERLQSTNAHLIQQAHVAIHNLDRHAVPPNNAMVFMMYQSIPEVRSLGVLYDINARQIRKYEDHAAATKNYADSVINHYNGLLNAGIERRLNQIDSLLDVKARLVR